jgi:hypothetical protein
LERGAVGQHLASCIPGKCRRGRSGVFTAAIERVYYRERDRKMVSEVQVPSLAIRCRRPLPVCAAADATEHHQTNARQNYVADVAIETRVAQLG